MESNRRVIEKKIADLREQIRCTLDRRQHPAMSAMLMDEIAKLKALGGAE
jgi:hypothetical protein